MSDTPRTLLHELRSLGSTSPVDVGCPSAISVGERTTHGGDDLVPDEEWGNDDVDSEDLEGLAVDGAANFALEDPALAAFLDDARADLDANLTSDPGTPDFAATVRLAHVIDPVSVPASWVEQAELEANVVPLRRRSTLDAIALAPFVSALRDAVDGAALERRMGGIPPLRDHAEEAAHVLPTIAGVPASARQDSPTSGSITRIAAVAALAAVVALGAFAGLSAMSSDDFVRGALPSASRTDMLELSRVAVDGIRTNLANQPGAMGVSPLTSPGRELNAPTILESGEADPTSAALQGPLASDTAAPSTGDRDDEARSPSRAVSRPRTSTSSIVAAAERRDASLVDEVDSMTLDERLLALETVAATAWREGRLDEARDSLELLIKMGGKHRRVEAAFADLFAITRQQLAGAKREAALVDLWSRYLERFPKGRHADDARAGLCRVASDDERAACWTSYVVHLPNGEHVDHARAWIAEHGGNPP